MKVRSIFFAFFCIVLASCAYGTPEFFKVFAEKYKNSPLLTQKCLICHLGSPPKRNPYGKSVEAIIANDIITGEGLATLESQDSDGDGHTNIDEINTGTAPGDPKAFPATSAPVASTPADQPLIPTHSFHPPIVHFPIALFLFGAFLEVLGRWKKRSELQQAGFWNMMAGFVTGIAAVTTGLIASFRLGYGIPPKPPVFIHFITAIIGFLLMGLALVVRTKNAKAYLACVLLAAAIVGLTGHLGGLVVFP